MQIKFTGLMTMSLAVSFFLNCTSQSENNSHPKATFEDIVKAQLQRYPQMGLEDLYKLVHQAAMGNIHLGADATMLKNYLVQEMARIEASEEEPLVETISPDGLVRVNLRPYKAKGGDPQALLKAMLETAAAFTPDRAKITEYWKTIEALADKGLIPLEARAARAFIKEMEVKGFPAVHHSKEYADSYRPAYRVILKRYLPQ